jgi:predicted nucleotidyltransferase
VPNGEKPLPVSSSTAPCFPREQEELFHGVLQHLLERKVPFVISGAFALQAHTGIWRDTKDLDLFIPAKHVPGAMDSLREQGFTCEVTDPVWLAKAHSGEYFVDLITGMSNAVIVVDDSWVERGLTRTVFGLEVKVLAAEELVASKLFVTRRERFDGADIAHVFHGVQRRFDWKRMLQLVGEHWEILLWALQLFHYVYPRDVEAVPKRIWDDLLGRFRESLEHPDPKAPFRGSLIDPMMFAIDVNEWGMENLLEGYRARRRPKLPEQCEPVAIAGEPRTT